MADAAIATTPTPAGPSKAGTIVAVTLSLGAVIGCGLLFAHLSRTYQPRRG